MYVILSFHCPPNKTLERTAGGRFSERGVTGAAAQFGSFGVTPCHASRTRRRCQRWPLHSDCCSWASGPRPVHPVSETGSALSRPRNRGGWFSGKSGLAVRFRCRYESFFFFFPPPNKVTGADGGGPLQRAGRYGRRRSVLSLCWSASIAAAISLRSAWWICLAASSLRSLGLRGRGSHSDPSGRTG